MDISKKPMLSGEKLAQMDELGKMMDSYAFGEIDLRELLKTHLDFGKEWVLDHEDPMKMIREVLAMAFSMGMMITITANNPDEYEEKVSEFFAILEQQIVYFDNYGPKVAQAYAVKREMRKTTKGGNA